MLIAGCCRYVLSFLCSTLLRWSGSDIEAPKLIRMRMQVPLQAGPPASKYRGKKKQKHLGGGLARLGGFRWQFA